MNQRVELAGVEAPPRCRAARSPRAIATDIGSYAGALFTNDGFGGWTSETLANSPTLTFTEGTGALAITAVPEPSTRALAVMGDGTAAWIVRRRARST